MVPVYLTKELIKMFQFVEGETTEQKVVNLVNGNVALKLRECEEAIVKFEAKYGLTFKDFKTAWEKNKIPGKHSHEIERDFMEWEGYGAEKAHWLSTARKFKIKFPLKG